MNASAAPGRRRRARRLLSIQPSASHLGSGLDLGLTLGDVGTKEQQTLSAAEGWREVSFRQTRDTLKLVWASPTNESLADFAVTASAALDQRRSALTWKLRVDNRSKAWAVRQVVFPQLSVPELGENAAVLFPRGRQRLRPER